MSVVDLSISPLEFEALCCFADAPRALPGYHL